MKPFSSHRLRSEDVSLYIQGIRQAEQQRNCEGKHLITYASEKLRETLGVEDDIFCHIDTPIAPDAGLANTNHRELTDVASWLLPYLAAQCKESLHLLFLGPGAGYECAQARMLVPDAWIATRSLSPINPYQVPLLCEHGMHRMREEGKNGINIENGESELQKLLSQFYSRSSSAPSLLMEIDRLVPKPIFFQTTSEPFIDEQHIGSFPTETPITQHQHFIYDRFGPLHKAKEKNVLIESMRHVQSRLHSAGVFVFYALPSKFFRDSVSVVRDCLLPRFTAVHNQTIESFLIAQDETIDYLMRRDHPWSSEVCVKVRPH